MIDYRRGKGEKKKVGKGWQYVWRRGEGEGRDDCRQGEVEQEGEWLGCMITMMRGEEGEG